MMPLRIGLTNTVSLNGGDAAIALCIVDALRQIEPDAAIELYDNFPAVAKRYFPDLDWRTRPSTLLGPRIPCAPLRESAQRLQRRRLFAGLRSPNGEPTDRPWRTRREGEALTSFLELDRIVSTGGTYLVEQYPLLARIFEFELALEFGIPLILYTQSLGPFRPRYHRALRTVFDRARLIVLRDEMSLAHVRSIGVRNEAIHVAADPVFALSPAAPEFPVRPESGERRRIGVSVRPWPVRAKLTDPPMRHYVAAMARAISDLAETVPAEFVLISTCQGIAEYPVDDAAVAKAIMATVDPKVRPRVTTNHDFHTPDSFRRVASEFDLFIATRMHAAILALTAGTPVVAIAYEFKTHELFDRLGVSNYVLDIKDLDPTTLSKVTTKMMADLDGDLRPKLAEAVSKARISAVDAIGLLGEAVRGT